MDNKNFFINNEYKQKCYTCLYLKKSQIIPIVKHNLTLHVISLKFESPPHALIYRTVVFQDTTTSRCLRKGATLRKPVETFGVVFGKWKWMQKILNYLFNYFSRNFVCEHEYESTKSKAKKNAGNCDFTLWFLSFLCIYTWLNDIFWNIMHFI